MSTVDSAVVVPDSAVQRGPNGLYVYVVTPASKAELRNVKVGRIEGDRALVENNLSAGERIVTSGHYLVQPGAPVQVLDDQKQRADATPATGKAGAP